MIYSRRLEAKDCADAAKLHSEAFKNFFLSKLGIGFLTQFYGALVRRRDTTCLGYWDDHNHMVGFCVANHNHVGFYKDLCFRNAFSFIASSIHIFLRNPLLLARLAKSFLSSSEVGAKMDHPYLMSICVSPSLQNAGIGKRMIHDLIEILRKEGFKGIYLTTDADENDAANSFYLRNMFTVTGTIFQGSRRMNVYFRIIE